MPRRPSDSRDRPWLRRGGFAALAVLAVAIPLRLGFWAVNPPNNAYDDHLEVIATYARGEGRPDPAACWQCYQPPLYYLVSAGLLNTAHAAGVSLWSAWKTVQLAGPLLSLLNLWFAWHLARRLDLPAFGALTAVLGLAVLPRDAFGAAFVSNDVAVQALSGLSLLLFALFFYAAPARLWHLAALTLAATAAALSKQHGIICMILPAALALRHVRQGARLWPAALVLGAGAAAVAVEEGWKILQTGELLLSNQHLYDWAESQKPGDPRAVEFTTLRLAALYQTPWMDDATLPSLWTEVFARLWFDYETKMLAPVPLTAWLARAAFTGGLVLSALWLAGLISFLRKSLRGRWEYAVFAGIQLAFLCVPLAQTLRFPYFSSMKATFVLPASAIAAVTLGQGATILGRAPAGRVVIGAALVALAACDFGYLYVAATMIGEVLPDQPLWPFPPVAP